MHRIDAAGFAVGNLFTDGNPSTGTPATVVDAAWLNDQQENVAQLVEAAGIVLSKGDYTQLLKAIVTKGMQGCYFNIGTAAGTADAITSSYTPAIAALTNGMTLYVRASAANATTTPTFTPNNGVIAAKAIVKGAGAALAAGDIAGGGHWIELQWDSVLDKWVLLNPATGISAAAVPAASDTVAGKTKVVTAAVDATYADNSTSAASTGWVRGAMLAIATAAGFAASFTTNGYIKFPAWLGGLILQWGKASSMSGGAALVITLPLTFPAGCLALMVQRNDNIYATNLGSMSAVVTSTSQITIRNGSTDTLAPMWFALGN